METTPGSPDVSFALEGMNLGAEAAKSWRGDVDKLDMAGSAGIITGWDSELSELSSSDENDSDQSDSEANKVSSSPQLISSFYFFQILTGHFIHRRRAAFYQVLKSVFLEFYHVYPILLRETPSAYALYDTATVPYPRPPPIVGNCANHVGHAVESISGRGWTGQELMVLRASMQRGKRGKEA